jgi:hemerythrin
MPIALWSEQFELGIGLIDFQHRELFEALNALADAIRDGAPEPRLDEGMAFIAQRTIKHFQTEETLMKEIEYPSRGRHTEQHNELVLQVRFLQYEQMKGRPVTLDTAAAMSDWFDHHIKESDMAYADHLKALSLETPPACISKPI